VSEWRYRGNDDALPLPRNRGIPRLRVLILRKPGSKLPHFIFLDLRMPRYNGKKCLQEIKKDERLKHIPVIIYSTSREVEESQELKAMGAVHFISKPSNPDEIYYLVSFVLEEQLNAARRIH